VEIVKHVSNFFFKHNGAQIDDLFVEKRGSGIS